MSPRLKSAELIMLLRPGPNINKNKDAKDEARVKKYRRITFALIQGFSNVSIIQYTCKSHFDLQR